MSATSSSVRSSKIEKMSSGYDMSFGDSDVESSSSVTDQEPVIPKDYWFGKKYFECVIAQNLIQRTRIYENAADIDSKFEAVIRAFPYRLCLQKLEARNLVVLLPDSSKVSSEAHQQVLTCVGAVVREGTREDRSTLIAILREQSTTQISELDGSRKGREESQLQRRVDDVSLVGASLGQYSVALQQYGAQHSFAPTYDVQVLSTIPPKFEATVSFESFKFQSVARNKKQARHQAARKACESLQIPT